jgi:predicted TIM-barrel fold metal-dependent hydrolase
MNKIDFHVHALNNEVNAQDSIRFFANLCEMYDLTGICVHAVECSSILIHPDCNEKALAIANANPNWYAFAGLKHAQDFVEQTKQYMDQGLSGIKLLEGKPSLYRHYGYTYDHPRFEPFFAYCEEHQIPLMIHNNDPIHHWDINKISQSAKDKGWYYDNAIPSQEYFFQALEGVLHRHPNLRAAIAHFGFYSNNIARAEKLMANCPNLRMDMTPALIIFDEFSQTPDAIKSFIMKYQDRLLFGSDAETTPDGQPKPIVARKTKIMNAFYEGSGEYIIDDHRIRGMALDGKVLENIYWNNAMAFMGI